MSTLRVNNMTNVGGDGSTYAKGHVVQVVNEKTLVPVSNSSTTFIDTGLTATITPKFATSKILVIVSQNGLYKSSSNASNAIWLQLLRGSEALAIFGYAIGLNLVAQIGYVGGSSIEYLDSPNTTSPVIYKTQFRNEAAASLVSVQANYNGTSTITLMEIAQ